jgi:hypothetical protein
MGRDGMLWCVRLRSLGTSEVLRGDVTGMISTSF